MLGHSQAGSLRRWLCSDIVTASPTGCPQDAQCQGLHHAPVPPPQYPPQGDRSPLPAQSQDTAPLVRGDQLPRARVIPTVWVIPKLSLSWAANSPQLSSGVPPAPGGCSRIHRPPQILMFSCTLLGN